MAGQFGLSFLPGTQDQSQQTGGGGPRTGASRNPMQEAVKILSLRLPKFYGSQSLAPAPLLSAAGGMGQPAARGNVTAQALAGLAGLPPSMAMPQAAAPMVMPQAAAQVHGVDTTPAFNQQASRSQAQQPQSVSWPAPQPQQTYQQQAPQQTSWAPPPPRITPGQEAPAGQGLYDPPPAQPVSSFSYDQLDVPAYQSYQGSNEAISPYEFWLKQQGQ